MATKVLDRAIVSAHKEAIVNDSPKTHEDWEIGMAAHQGDLTFVCISRPASATPRKNLQLAEGATQGSRHVLESGNAYDCDPNEVSMAIKAATKCDVSLQYLGIVFSGAGATVTHPEHGDHAFVPDRCTAVVYQRSLDAEEREMRTQD